MGSITATIPMPTASPRLPPRKDGRRAAVSIVNKTKKTSFPAPVAADGRFSATFAVGVGDTLVVAMPIGAAIRL